MSFATDARAYMVALGEGARFVLDDLMPIATKHGMTRRGVWDLIDRMEQVGEVEVIDKIPGTRGGHPKNVYVVGKVAPVGRARAKHNEVREHLRANYKPGQVVTTDDIKDKFTDASSRLRQLADRGELSMVGFKGVKSGRPRVVYLVVRLDEPPQRRELTRKVKQVEVVPPPAGMWDGLLVGGEPCSM